MTFDHRLNLISESVNTTIQYGKILKNQQFIPTCLQTGIKKSKTAFPNVC